MKAAKLRQSIPRRSPRSKDLSGIHDFTLDEARACLGQLVAMAARGEPVCIVHGDQRLVLQPEAPVKPVLLHTAGYFAGCYTQEEIGMGGAAGDPSAPFGPEVLG